MVYPGRPSRGCITCIARRVKCDEGKPGCDRCRKRDQPCPGYRDPNDVKFVHTTGRRKSKSSRSVSQSPLATPAPHDSNENISDSDAHHVGRRTRSKMLASNVPSDLLHQNTPNTPSLSLLDRPRIQNWEEQAICFFFHRYTLQSSHNDNPGWLDFLPELYQQSEPESALAHSTRAISFASLSSASSVKNLVMKGHQSYGLALKMVNASLRDPGEVLQDSLIVAILLLALFENFYRERPAILMEHAKGLHILIVLRGADQFRTSRGWAIFRQVHTHMARSLALKEQPALETVRWMHEMDKSFPAARSAWCMFRITQISATAAELLSLEPPTQTAQESLHSLLREAQDIESEYAHWQDGADPRWEFRAWNLEANQPVEVKAADARFNRQTSHRPGEGSEKPVSSQRVLTYTNFWFSNIWNGYRSTRCVLHEIMLRIAHHLKISTWTTGSIETSTSLVEELLEETCDSIPYTTGDVQVDAAGHLQLTPISDPLERQGSAAGAYFLLWPLYRVVVCPIATRSQIKMATDALLRIGQKFGIRLAFALAEVGCK